MAFDAYMVFTDHAGTPIKGESQVTWSDSSPLGSGIQGGNLFEIDDFNFDIEQVLNIGSQSSGAGAGKVTFNPFNITRKTDRASPIFFSMCCAGTHFKEVFLLLRRAGGSGATVANAQGTAMTSGYTFLKFSFGLVAVKTISWSGSDGDESPKEEVAFEYGALKAEYIQQGADGQPMVGDPGQTVGSWVRVNNTSNFDAFISAFKAT